MSWLGNPFTAGQLKLADAYSPAASPQLQLPAIGSSASQPASLGGYAAQLDPYSSAGSGMSDSAMGGIAGAGIGAAGNTIATLAQLMGAQSTRDYTAKQNQLGRANTLDIAKAQIAAAQQMAANERRDEAVRYLLGALQNQTSTGFDASGLQRGANQGFGNLISQAFMKGK